MGPLDLLWHLAGFLAPAAGVALLVSLFARVLLPASSGARSWKTAVTVDFLAGTAALVAGLLLFGRDGTMLTYATLVVACGTSQWLLGRSWK